MINEFNPPERLLMGPGPANVAENVLQALSRPTVGHLDPAFIGMMDELRQLLQFAFQTQNAATFALSAPGSAGMECCFVNLLEPGDEVLICINGVFGQRMRENAERCGARVTCLHFPWGQAIDVNVVEDALQKNTDYKLLAFVHAETSTGVRSDAESLGKLAKKYHCLSLMDCVTSLGGIELKLDEWEIDAAYSGTQKCLSCPPGLSPVSFGAEALAAIQARRTPVQSWFLDMNLLMGYWQGEAQTNKRAYHHTAPVNALYGLHQALLNLREEGLTIAHQRHSAAHEHLVGELASLEIDFVVDEENRLPQLNAVKIPDYLDDSDVRRRLLAEFNIEIGAGLGDFAGKVWRIGLMGHSAQIKNVERLMKALKTIV